MKKLIKILITASLFILTVSVGIKYAYNLTYNFTTEYVNMSAKYNLAMIASNLKKDRVAIDGVQAVYDEYVAELKAQGHTTVEKVIMQAAMGVPKAQYVVANDLVVKGAYEKAKPYMQKAADAGLPIAKFGLAQMYIREAIEESSLSSQDIHDRVKTAMPFIVEASDGGLEWAEAYSKRLERYNVALQGYIDDPMMIVVGLLEKVKK